METANPRRSATILHQLDDNVRELDEVMSEVKVLMDSPLKHTEVWLEDWHKANARILELKTQFLRIKTVMQDTGMIP